MFRTGWAVRGLGLWLALMILVPAAILAQKPPQEGEPFPRVGLPAPKEEHLKNYLGLAKEKKSFHLGQVKGEVVLVEVFSMYCPFCQAEAVKVNKLYQRIEEDPNLKGRIKVIGIGAGNSTYEVSFFKDQFNIPFPLIPDDDFAVYKTIGSVRTPFFIGVKLSKDGATKVFLTHKGPFEEVEGFLKTLIEKSGVLGGKP